MINTNELFDSNSAMYVLGYAMKSPRTVVGDRYLLTLGDFTTSLYKSIFGAVWNLASDGAARIYPQDVDFYLAQYKEQYKLFQEGKGLEFLNQLEQLESGDDEALFQLHYDRVKKFTILRELNKQGIDTSDIYDPRVDFFKIDAENEKLNRLNVDEILDKIRIKIAKIEKQNVNKNDVYFQNAAKGLRQLVAELKENPEIGPSLEGDKISYITRGARFGKYYLVSMPSGGGKTRCMLGNACRMAFPRIEGDKIVFQGELHKVLFITTEQLPDEIQTLIVAYVSGVPEERLLYNMLTPEESVRVNQAIDIIEKYQDNFLLDVIPSPNMSNVRAKILEPILDKGVDMVFYDYLFLPNDDDGFSKNHQYRTDQLLMMLSTQLKDIAAAYNVFVLSATQLNASWEDKMVRNMNMLRDSKSIADKADIGMISVRLQEQEWKMVETYFEQLGIEQMPNQVVDIYKNRRGSVTGAKVFRYFDYGTCRATDLLLTSQSFKLLPESNADIKYGDVKTYNLLDFLSKEVWK